MRIQHGIEPPVNSACHPADAGQGGRARRDRPRLRRRQHSNLGGASGEAVAFITPGQSAATFKVAKKEVPGAVSVAGIGNGAFYSASTGSIEMLKGNTVATAQGIFLDANAHPIASAKMKADVVTLAKAVAKHL